MCSTLVVQARRTWLKARLERAYLDAERYWVRINGNLQPSFWVEGHFPGVLGILLNGREVVVFPE